MARAIVVHANGGPEVLSWENVAIPDPGPGEVLIRHTAIGLNYIDCYHRTGLYQLPLPLVPGIEGCGVIEAQGEGATNFQIGDHIVYAGGPPGAYSEYRVISEKKIAKVPEGITDIQAAGVFLKGLTAHMLLRRTFLVGEGHWILLHAAAGGVGLLLSQWAKHLGAHVIGTVGSEEKAALALANGCEHVIQYRKEHVPTRVKQITGGRGVNVVYDSIGRDTFMDSLDCLIPLGMMVSFGQSSGPIPPIDIGILRDKGCLYLTRPTLTVYKQDHVEYLLSAAEMFDLITRHILHPYVNQSYYLHDAVRAHTDLEARKTTGASVLIPG